MGVLSNIRRRFTNVGAQPLQGTRPAAAPAKRSQSLWEFANGTLVSGGSYSREASSTWPAIHRSVNILSGVSARLLVDSARIIDRDRKEVRGSAANRYIDLLRQSPDNEIDSYAFLIDCVADMALSGNCVLYLRRGMGGRQYIDLCHPDYTQITWEESEYKFRIRPDREYEGNDTVAKLSEIAIGRNPRISGRYISGTPRTRFMADAPITRLSRMVLLALSAEQFVSEYFDRATGAAKSDIAITFEQALDRETQEKFRDAIQRFAEGRAPLFLTGGPKIEKIGASAQDSQTLQLREFSVSDCARALGIPEIFLSQSTGSVWGSSTAQLAVALHKYTIAPYISQLLESLSFRLLPSGWKFDVDYGRINVGDLELLAKVLPHVAPKSGQGDAILERNEIRGWLGIDRDYQRDWMTPEEATPGITKADNGTPS